MFSQILGRITYEMTILKRAGIFCIVIGICIAVFPFFKESYDEYQCRTLLVKWQEAHRIQNKYAIEDTESSEISYAEKKDTEVFSDEDEVIGILKISAIDLKQPILKSAETENLNISVAAIEPTGTPGETGNFAIAGHNSRKFGKHFNRINELKNGDEIIVETSDASYVYQVTDKYVVNADEVWILEQTAQKEITLVTCYYSENGEKKRLIVKGLLV